MAERIRAFMAILLPPALKDAAVEVQEQMQTLFPPGSVRWVARENLHLTLRFFGDLDRKGREKAEGVVTGLEGAVPLLRARILTASAFPSPARPQTLWVGVGDGSDDLDRFALEVDRRIRLAGFGPADKPWKSHLTLGRARDRSPRPEPDWAARLTWRSEESTITTIALMQSELGPRGPRYTPLRTASASPPPG